MRLKGLYGGSAIHELFSKVTRLVSRLILQCSRCSIRNTRIIQCMVNWYLVMLMSIPCH
jgi:hypothetical protein